MKDHRSYIRNLCTYQFKAGRGGGRAGGPQGQQSQSNPQGLLTDLAFPGEGIFERRLERKRLKPKLFFPRHACAVRP